MNPTRHSRPASPATVYLRYMTGFLIAVIGTPALVMYWSHVFDATPSRVVWIGAGVLVCINALVLTSKPCREVY